MLRSFLAVIVVLSSLCSVLGCSDEAYLADDSHCVYSLNNDCGTQHDSEDSHPCIATCGHHFVVELDKFSYVILNTDFSFNFSYRFIYKTPDLDNPEIPPIAA